MSINDLKAKLAELDIEATRSRAFIKAANTQLSKVIELGEESMLRLDALIALGGDGGVDVGTTPRPLPGAVGTLTLVGSTASSLTFSWTLPDEGNPNNELTHTARIWLDGGSWTNDISGQRKTIDPDAGTEVTFDGLDTENVNYHVAVESFEFDAVTGEAIGGSLLRSPTYDWTASAPSGDPGEVTDLAVDTIDEDSATLTWTPVGDGEGGDPGYVIRWGDQDAEWWEMPNEIIIPAGVTSSHEVTGLPAGTGIGFRIVAYRGTVPIDPGAGEAYGPISGVVNDTTSAATFNPGTITVSIVSSTELRIQGTVHEGGVGSVTTFLERSTTGAFSGEETTVANPFDLDENDSGLTTDQEYFYRMGHTDSDSPTNTVYSTIKSATPEAAPDPTGSGPGPNEPAGFTFYADREFTVSEGVFPGYPWNATNYTTPDDLSIVTEDGRSCVRFHYPSAWPKDGHSPGQIRLGLEGRPKEVYIRIVYKYSSNYVWHPNINKILYILDDQQGGNGDPGPLIVRGGVPGGGGTWNVRLQGAWPDVHAAYFPENFSSVAPGVWHDTEVHCVMNDDGTVNASAQVWQDGTALFDDLSGIGFSEGPGNGWSKIHIDPIYGGAGQGPPAQDMELFVDYFYVSTKG